MKIYFVNDCFVEGQSKVWHHYGSKAVTDSILFRIRQAGHDVVHICKKPFGPELDKIKQIDALIINGEGTFRDEERSWEKGRHEALKLGMIQAKELKKKVYLFNTTWYNMRATGWEILKELDGISTRDIYSRAEIQKLTGWEPDLHIDETYFHSTVGTGEDLRGKEVVGEMYPQNTKNNLTIDYPYFKCMNKLSLLERNWTYVINSLRGAKFFITGQHHGVYAAAKARCIFIPIKVNTWKLKGLFDYAQFPVPIATNLKEIKSGIEWALQNRVQYDKFFDWMEQQEPWSIPK